MILKIVFGCFFIYFFAVADTHPGLADKVYSHALERLQEKEYELSVELFRQLPKDYLQVFPRALNYAKAQVGFCGLDVNAVMNQLESYEGTLFGEMVRGWSIYGTPVRRDSYYDCSEAYLILDFYRGPDLGLEERLLMAYTALGSINKVLSLYADGDADGVLDWHFDACSRGSIDDLAATDIFKLMRLARYQFQRAGSFPIGRLALESLNQACKAAQFISREFCHQESLDAAGIFAMRSLINEGQIIGVGECDFSDGCLCL